jgi:hypothetical protein
MSTLLPGLVLGFPPVRGKAWKKGYTRCPSRRNGRAHGRHCIGAGLPTRISPGPQKNHAPEAPSHSTKLAAHQLAPPRSCNHHRRVTGTKESRPTGMKMGIREQGTAEQRTRGRARPPPPMAVTDRTQQQEQTRPSWPGRAHGLVKLPTPRCSRHAAVRPSPARATSLAAGGGTSPPRPSPPRPR